MTDACDAPNACQSNSLSGEGGTFGYNCPYLPPSPQRFGLTSYDLTLLPVVPNNNFLYNISNEDGVILTFTNTNASPYKFTTIRNVLAGYEAAIVQTGDVLTITKGNLRWIIGINVRFSSCLITEGYKLCNSPNTPPTSQAPTGSATPILFTFPCPLPSSLLFGLSNYELRLIYLGGMQYDVYLNPNATGFVRVGSFVYGGEPGEFSQLITYSNYILRVVDGNLVLYENTSNSPIWVLSVFNFIFSAEINVPPGPCTQAVAVVPEVSKTFTFSGCPQLSTQSNVLATILANTGQSVRSRLTFVGAGNVAITSTYFNGTAPIIVNNQSSRITITNITNTSFNIEIRNLVYKVQYTDGQLFVTADTRQNLLGGSFLSPGPNIVPNIFAQIEPSADGKQICVLNFRITEETRTHLSTRVGGPSPFTERSIRTYRQYCVSFASVICAPGCRKGTGSTLQEKLDALQVGNDFVQYMVLRYILSALLCKNEFNKFDVDLLRQRYNERFLRLLAKTQYRVFLPQLKANPQFATYFKC